MLLHERAIAAWMLRPDAQELVQVERRRPRKVRVGWTPSSWYSLMGVLPVGRPKTVVGVSFSVAAICVASVLASVRSSLKTVIISPFSIG